MPDCGKDADGLASRGGHATRSSGHQFAVDRRSILAAAGSTVTASLAGCTGAFRSEVDDEDHGESVLFWNEQFLETVRQWGSALSAPMNVSMFDAVNAITAARGNPHYDPYLVPSEDAPAGASRPAACAAAAYEALSHRFTVDLREPLETALGGVEALDGDVDDGKAWGRTVVDRIVAHREDEAVGGEPNEPCSDDPDAPGCFRGQWPPELPATWTLSTPDQFRPDGPPALESEAYADAWHEVYELGANTPDRPREDVEQARFWTSLRPSNVWDAVGLAVASERELSLLETARTFALSSLAIADAGNCAVEAKYHYGFWRPQTAIHEANDDGNPDTFADPDWEPMAVGGSPEYPSALTAIGAAQRRILVAVLGDGDRAVELEHDTVGASRSFDDLEAALADSATSRLYLGNHFGFSLEDGIEAGEDVGAWVYENHLQPVE